MMRQLFTLTAPFGRGRWPGSAPAHDPTSRPCLLLLLQELPGLRASRGAAVAYTMPTRPRAITLGRWDRASPSISVGSWIDVSFCSIVSTDQYHLLGRDKRSWPLFAGTYLWLHNYSYNLVIRLPSTVNHVVYTAST